jgi:hypothetical protein
VTILGMTNFTFAHVVLSLIGILSVASGAATAAEIDIDTLEQRLVADAPKTGVVGTVSAGFVSVWAIKPQ